MRIRQCLLLLAPVLLPALLAACVPADKPQPASPPAVAPSPRPVPPPVSRPAPPQVEWQDLELTSGNWSYSAGERGSQASFGSGDPSFILRCDRPSRQIQLLRPGVASGNAMTVHTSEAVRSLPLSSDAAAAPYASLGANDPMLDNIAFSRGRFSIEVPGLPMLVIPSWPEPARVIEDCRG